MHIFYLVTTFMAALANGYAAVLNFARAESVKVVANRVHVSQRWMRPFGTLLAAGAIGLLVGLTVPTLGIAAAGGLIVYFLCAVGAHIRARDRGFGGAVSFLILASTALAANVAYHGYW